MYYTRMEQLSIHINSFTFRMKADTEICETRSKNGGICKFLLQNVDNSTCLLDYFVVLNTECNIFLEF